MQRVTIIFKRDAQGNPYPDKVVTGDKVTVLTDDDWAKVYVNDSASSTNSRLATTAPTENILRIDNDPVAAQ